MAPRRMRSRTALDLSTKLPIGPPPGGRWLDDATGQRSTCFEPGVAPLLHRFARGCRRRRAAQQKRRQTCPARWVIRPLVAKVETHLNTSAAVCKGGMHGMTVHNQHITDGHGQRLRCAFHQAFGNLQICTTVDVLDQDLWWLYAGVLHGTTGNVLANVLAQAARHRPVTSMRRAPKQSHLHGICRVRLLYPLR